jgi:hypothetical protein
MPERVDKQKIRTPAEWPNSLSGLADCHFF